ncbi:glutathione-disulfide reductase [Derxia lacustris]|uniref:glutathione-disulfide reductase n=1 Tax=Derxia lacustris TaxID=764842 RepID=UPI000A1703F4|nr:glutathione-disulfide reductase [Derxia lacustris]
MSRYDYDLITLGAGSGGVAGSRYAASKGVRVAICEDSRVGGTCVIRGCVPKKLFMYGAQFSDAFADAAGYGWTVPEPSFDLAVLAAAKAKETDRLEGIYRKLLADSGVTLIDGRGRLLDAHTVDIGGKRVTAERILIATGGKPAAPAIPGIELALTSNELLDLTERPARLLVLGAGYIAVEFAGIFRGFGSAVTVAYRGDAPLRGFDEDLRRRLATELGNRGVALEAGFAPAGIERVGAEFIVRSADGRELRADAVLNALGRVPNSRGIGLEEAGVEIDAKTGAVVVDGFSRTTLPGVFAVGDVTNRVALTPVAIAEARAFVDTEFGNTPRHIDHSLIASAVFSQPPIGSIGLSEEAAKARGLRVTVFESDFRPMKNTISGRTERSYMKLVVDSTTDKVLGLHMIGTDAGELVQGFAVAITMGATKADFDRTIAVHPTAGEEFVLMRTPRKAG